jgi:uncharacterized protein YbaR (Trm112 family)
MNLDPALLAILVCPKCHSGLNVNEAEQTLDCQNAGGECGLRFPVRDEIPVMLIDEAVVPTTGS